MIFAYYRVSTDKQDYESQRLGVLEYAKRNNLIIDYEVVDDGVSGTVLAKNRKLNTILTRIEQDDLIITSELSRIGRNTADVLNTCAIITEKKAKCYFVKQSMGIDSSPMGKMFIAIMAAFAEMERDLISMRTIEGLKRARERGSILGRRNGSLNKVHKYKEIILSKRDYIYICAKNQLSLDDLCRHLHTSRPTFYKYKNCLDFDYQKVKEEFKPIVEKNQPKLKQVKNWHFYKNKYPEDWETVAKYYPKGFCYGKLKFMVNVSESTLYNMIQAFKEQSGIE